MRKIILSVAAAAMALSTTASALEDIKVSGQAKFWYETSDLDAYTAPAGFTGTRADNVSLFEKEGSTGEIVFKLGVTGKQGNVGFGTTIYQTSSMGLNDEVISGYRTLATDGDMFVGEAYVTAPMGSMTSLKLGKQELNTPYLFTESWNALPNTFDAAVVTVKPMDGLSLVAMYVGADNATNFKAEPLVDNELFGGALVAGALYKNSTFDANFWYTNIGNAAGTGTPVTGGSTLTAYWLDAGVKVADINLRGYATSLAVEALDDTTKAFALSAGTKVGDFDLFAAASTVSDEDNGHAVNNISTGGKKSSLPTEGVYTDGVYVAQNGSDAYKLKVSTKIASTGVALQGVMNTNSNTPSHWNTGVAPTATTANDKETTEVDLFITDKFGDFSTTAILMHRSFKDDATDDKSGGIYARFIVALNF